MTGGRRESFPAVAAEYPFLFWEAVRWLPPLSGSAGFLNASLLAITPQGIFRWRRATPVSIAARETAGGTRSMSLGSKGLGMM